MCIRDRSINTSAAEDTSQKGMGATLALAWFTPENLYFTNVGDSRIYLHRNGETRMLTTDHTFAWKKLQRGEISERQYREHPRRSVLYQVVGSGKNQVKPTTSTLHYQPGDRFLICSDGLIDGLWEKHIHSSFIRITENQCSTTDLTSSLMSRAMSNDGSDDTTLITLAVRTNEQND